jgi:hypothetical protein
VQRTYPSLRCSFVEAECNWGSDNPVGPPILRIHVVVASNVREKIRNEQKAMVDGRIRLIYAVLLRRAIGAVNQSGSTDQPAAIKSLKPPTLRTSVKPISTSVLPASAARPPDPQ